MHTLKTLVFVVLSCSSVARADNPTFMMAAGVSASSEMCLTAENGDVDVEGAAAVVEPCAAAVAAGDGRELWQYMPNGQISNVAGKKCLGLRDNSVAEGGHVILMDCDHASSAGDGRSAWETQGNGQLKLGRAGQYCLSQKGSAAGVEDVAAKGAITASSSADAAAHGANMAVDGSASTFWASALDSSEPVSITIDLGGERSLRSASILWEFPAKSFTVSVSTDGVKWSEVFATDSNVLSSTTIPLGAVAATKARVVMHEAHATAGSFQGHAVYGIKTLALYAPRLQSIVEDCAAASKSADARDKYFQTYVGEAGSCSSKALRSELPSLEAARASVASVASELADALPKLGSCRRGASFVKSNGAAGRAFVSEKVAASGARRSGKALASQTGQNVDAQNGIDTDALNALLGEARRLVIAARSALF